MHSTPPGRSARKRGCLPGRWQSRPARQLHAPVLVGSNTGRTA
jgi:hypothetical protein